jgi:catechol 2,3-dioxygenase-like lactoylglutathione lyase family enzyme
MIEHISLRCRDVKWSREFYARALAPLGYRLHMDFPEAAGFFADGHTSFWVTRGKVRAPIHVAFRARSRRAVEAFYEAALAAGAKDNGAPGLREYGPDYYAAFVLDRDGHNIEAVTFAKPHRRSARTRK